MPLAHCVIAPGRLVGSSALLDDLAWRSAMTFAFIGTYIGELAPSAVCDAD